MAPREQAQHHRRAVLLSARTGESHRAHIQKKLGRSTRAELVRYALDITRTTRSAGATCGYLRILTGGNPR